MEHYKATFAKIFTGQTISLLTSAIVQYAIVWYLTFTTGSAMVLSFAMIAATLPQILLGPFAGVLIDRVDRKKVMIASDSFIALATIVLVILFMLGKVPLSAIYIILAVRSIGSSFHTPSFQASIPLIAPKDKIVKISGLNQTITAISNVAAPMLAGILYGVWKIEYIILLDIIGAIFGVLSIAIVKIPKIEKKNTKLQIREEIREATHEIKKSKFLSIIIIYVIIIQIIFMPVGTLFPLMTSNYFKLQPIDASIVETVFSVGMLLGGILLSLWGGFKKKQYTLILSILVFGITLVISGILPIHLFYVFVILCGIMGMMASLFDGIAMAMIQLKIPADKLGRVVSIIMSLMLAATPIGLLICAPFAEKIGVNNWIWISGVVIVLVSLLTLCLKTVQKETWEMVPNEKEEQIT